MDQKTREGFRLCAAVLCEIDVHLARSTKKYAESKVRGLLLRAKRFATNGDQLENCVIFFVQVTLCCWNFFIISCCDFWSQVLILLTLLI